MSFDHSGFNCKKSILLIRQAFSLCRMILISSQMNVCSLNFLEITKLWEKNGDRHVAYVNGCSQADQSEHDYHVLQHLVVKSGVLDISVKVVKRTYDSIYVIYWLTFPNR